MSTAVQLAADAGALAGVSCPALLAAGFYAEICAYTNRDALNDSMHSIAVVMLADRLAECGADGSSGGSRAVRRVSLGDAAVEFEDGERSGLGAARSVAVERGLSAFDQFRRVGTVLESS